MVRTHIGIRVAVSGLVLASIIVSAAGVHLLWWRTAEQTSQTLAATINQQIVAEVSDELQSITAEARSAYTALRTLFRYDILDPREIEKRKYAFLSQLQSQPTISWIALGCPDGSFSATHKLGDSAIQTMEIVPGETRLQIDQYKLDDIDLRFTSRRTENTPYSVTAQEWFREAIESEGERWFDSTSYPGQNLRTVSLAGPITAAQQRLCVLSIGIELVRVSRFLSQLESGKSAGAFILDRNGAPIAAPDPDADELHGLKTNHPLFPAAVDAIRKAGTTYNPDDAEPYRTRISQDGQIYEAVLTPISFSGWSLVTIVPESEFLGPVQTTINRLLVGVAVMITAASLLSAWFAQRVIAAPLLKVVAELKHVERFDLEKVKTHPSRLTEIESLSGAIRDMAQALVAFRKYIPADLVKRLIGEGTEARLGGTVRPMTVMFVDMANFTGMSERLGDRIIPILSRYFDSISVQIQHHGGTIDKFIGDAVMAFWGAPASNPGHAVDCCQAALACQRAVRELGLVDDSGQAVKIRIGINSGDMLVGNIGSEVRFNYTVIGDAVNVASRLESANKLYGSEIIIGPETRRLAGDQILVRELDHLAVYGRAGEIVVHELIEMAVSVAGQPDWIDLYQKGLAHFRAQEFKEAIRQFERVLELRPNDLPTKMMIDRCNQFELRPPGDNWKAVTIAQFK